MLRTNIFPFIYKINKINNIKNIKMLSCNKSLDKPIINVTENAWKKINNIIKKTNNTQPKSSSMLLDISSGGCNGFNYKFNIITPIENKKISNYSVIVSPDNLNNKIYIDSMAEFYVIGTTIDYIKEDFTNNIFESKFLFTPDKSLATNCGCGISFSLK
tara:strand:+ start:357 stop:833 length:477 start_codon:yes stop_codon:yes gene_type:complete